MFYGDIVRQTLSVAVFLVSKEKKLAMNNNVISKQSVTASGNLTNVYDDCHGECTKQLD